jgi:hypothetical protein
MKVELYWIEPHEGVVDIKVKEDRKSLNLQ